MRFTSQSVVSLALASSVLAVPTKAPLQPRRDVGSCSTGAATLSDGDTDFAKRSLQKRKGGGAGGDAAEELLDIGLQILQQQITNAMDEHTIESQFTKSFISTLSGKYPQMSSLIYHTGGSTPKSTVNFNQIQQQQHMELQLCDFGRTQGYDAYLFVDGSIDHAGDGGDINWQYYGVTDRKDSHVDFKSMQPPQPVSIPDHQFVNRVPINHRPIIGTVVKKPNSSSSSSATASATATKAKSSSTATPSSTKTPKGDDNSDADDDTTDETKPKSLLTSKVATNKVSDNGHKNGTEPSKTLAARDVSLSSNLPIVPIRPYKPAPTPTGVLLAPLTPTRAVSTQTDGHYFLDCKHTNGTMNTGLAYYKDMEPGKDVSQLPDDFTWVVQDHNDRDWAFNNGLVQYPHSGDQLKWSMLGVHKDPNQADPANTCVGKADDGDGHFWVYKGDESTLFQQAGWTCDVAYYSF